MAINTDIYKKSSYMLSISDKEGSIRLTYLRKKFSCSKKKKEQLMIDRIDTLLL